MRKRNPVSLIRMLLHFILCWCEREESSTGRQETGSSTSFASQWPCDLEEIHSLLWNSFLTGKTKGLNQIISDVLCLCDVISLCALQ